MSGCRQATRRSGVEHRQPDRLLHQYRFAAPGIRFHARLHGLAALQAIPVLPAQLLSILRPDSIAAVVQDDSGVRLQFTGVDAYTYAVQVSPDLANWVTVSTNSPNQGVFDYVESLSPAAAGRFYRSVLLP